MMDDFLKVALFGATTLVTTFLVFSLFQILFLPEQRAHGSNHEQAIHTQNQDSNKEDSGRSVAISKSSATEEAIANYTKWLAIFTAFLVLATIALFVSGERNTKATRRAAEAAVKSAKVAEDGLFKLQRAFITFEGLACTRFR